MRGHLLDEALDAIVMLQIDDVAKTRCLHAIYAVGRQNGIKSVEVRERLEYAIYQLSKGVERRAIRDRLIRIHEISARQAIRVVAQAIQTRHLRPKNVAMNADNKRL